VGAGRPEKRNERGAICAICTRTLCFRCCCCFPAEITCMHSDALMHTSRAVLRFPPGTFVERALSARER
jgi:hypothetical protein